MSKSWLLVLSAVSFVGFIAACEGPPPPEPSCFGAGVGSAPGAPNACRSEAEWRAQALEQCTQAGGTLTEFQAQPPCGNGQFSGMNFTCCMGPTPPRAPAPRAPTPPAR